jgi:hypothetical protein
MAKREHEGHVYGVVPRSRRRLAFIVLAVCGIAVLVGGLLVNFLGGTAVQWPILMICVGFLVMVMALYLWIRLSD